MKLRSRSRPTRTGTGETDSRPVSGTTVVSRTSEPCPRRSAAVTWIIQDGVISDPDGARHLGEVRAGRHGEQSDRRSVRSTSTSTLRRRVTGRLRRSRSRASLRCQEACTTRATGRYGTMADHSGSAISNVSLSGGSGGQFGEHDADRRGRRLLDLAPTPTRASDGAGTAFQAICSRTSTRSASFPKTTPTADESQR